MTTLFFPFSIKFFTGQANYQVDIPLCLCYIPSGNRLHTGNFDQKQLISFILPIPHLQVDTFINSRPDKNTIYIQEVL